MNLLNLSDLDNRPFLKYIIIIFIAVNAVVLAMLLFGPGRLSPAASTASGSSGDSSTAAGITSESAEVSDESNLNEEEEESLSEDKDRDSEQEDGEDDADEAALGTTQEEELSDTSDEADEASEESSEGNTEESETREDGPVLELVSDHVTLKVGSYFNFYDYIKTMVDSNGTSLSQYIHLDGQVNTYAPGDYTITYKITSPITGITAAKDLLVTVEK